MAAFQGEADQSGGHHEMDRYSRLPSGDFIIIAEFSEREGPVPLEVYPQSSVGSFDVASFVVRIMSVDKHQTVESSIGALPPDSQDIINLTAERLQAYVHHTTVRDLWARGYVRPLCLVYITPEIDGAGKLFSHFALLRRCFGRVAKLLQEGNNSVFRRDCESRLLTLRLAQESAMQRTSRSESRVSMECTLGEENRAVKGSDVENGTEVSANPADSSLCGSQTDGGDGAGSAYRDAARGDDGDNSTRIDIDGSGTHGGTESGGGSGDDNVDSHSYNDRGESDREYSESSPKPKDIAAIDDALMQVQALFDSTSKRVHGDAGIADRDDSGTVSVVHDSSNQPPGDGDSCQQCDDIEEVRVRQLARVRKTLAAKMPAPPSGVIKVLTPSAALNIGASGGMGIGAGHLSHSSHANDSSTNVVNTAETRATKPVASTTSSVLKGSLQTTVHYGALRPISEICSAPVLAVVHRHVTALYAAVEQNGMQLQLNALDDAVTSGPGPCVLCVGNTAVVNVHPQPHRCAPSLTTPVRQGEHGHHRGPCHPHSRSGHSKGGDGASHSRAGSSLPRKTSQGSITTNGGGGGGGDQDDNGSDYFDACSTRTSLSGESSKGDFHDRDRKGSSTGRAGSIGTDTKISFSGFTTPDDILSRPQSPMVMSRFSTPQFARTSISSSLSMMPGAESSLFALKQIYSPAIVTNLVFALLIGRTVIVWSERKNHDACASLVAAFSSFAIIPYSMVRVGLRRSMRPTLAPKPRLSHLIAPNPTCTCPSPPNTRHLQLFDDCVTPWRETPISLGDLATCRIVGLCKEAGPLPRAIERYVTVFNVEEETLRSIPYRNSTIVPELLAFRKHYPDDWTFDAHVHKHLLDLGRLVFSYYHCVMIDSGRAMGGEPSLPCDVNETLRSLGVAPGSGDAEIIDALAETIRIQQDRHWSGVGPSHGWTLRLDFRPCAVFRNNTGSPDRKAHRDAPRPSSRAGSRPGSVRGSQYMIPMP